MTDRFRIPSLREMMLPSAGVGRAIKRALQHTPHEGYIARPMHSDLVMYYSINLLNAEAPATSMEQKNAAAFMVSTMNNSQIIYRWYGTKVPSHRYVARRTKNRRCTERRGVLSLFVVGN